MGRPQGMLTAYTFKQFPLVCQENPSHDKQNENMFQYFKMTHSVTQWTIPKAADKRVPAQQQPAPSLTGPGYTPRYLASEFSSLPPELREQIWLYTISPRTIHLHLHIRRTPVARKESPLSTTLTHSRAMRTDITAIAFSAAVGTVDCRSFEQGYRKGDRSQQEDSHLHTAVPPVHVPLFVCRESRAIALRHAKYVRAFAGRHLLLVSGHESDKAEKWLRGCRGKNTWVDFERDEIVIDRVGDLDSAREEMKKVQKLGVYRTESVEDYTTFCDEMIPQMPLLTSLREVSLYFKFEQGDVAAVERVTKAILKDWDLLEKSGRKFGCRVNQF